MTTTKDTPYNDPAEYDRLQSLNAELVAALGKIFAVAQGMKAVLGDEFTGTEPIFEETRALLESCLQAPQKPQDARD